MVGLAVERELEPRLAALDVDVVREAYARAGIEARTAWFLDRVADEMARATLIVCRAGATTLAELAAIGRAAVLIPFAAATDDHQRRNARVLEEAGAVEVIDERELGGDRLSSTIERLLADPALRERMGESARGVVEAHRGSLARLLELIETLLAPGEGTSVEAAGASG